MLKRRLIPVLYIKNGFIVRSEAFSEHKIIGNVVNTVRRFNEWDIDELVYIDISRDQNYDSRRDDHKIKRVKSINDILDLVSIECFMPLTFGGGIMNFNTIQTFLKNGADKVIVNRMLYENPEEIRKAVSTFGSQAIVGAIDYRVIDGNIHFFTEFDNKEIKMNPEGLVNYLSDLGVGEVFLTSIDRDGTGNGYDIESINKLNSLFNKPVVVCGGAIGTMDFEEVADKTNVSGIAAGNMFHFTENIYPRSKQKLVAKKYNFRI